MSQHSKIHWSAYFWPGLPQLWNRGSWAGLLVAVGFTALLNVLLLSTLVYGEWLKLETQLVGGGVLVVVWLLARWQSRDQRLASRAATTAAGGEDAGAVGEQAAPLAAERDQLFREAQGFYLQNDRVATEQLLLKLLKLDARDVESRLMLATLWRHQGRRAEALRQLDRLERLEAASKWQHEIAAERMAINEPEVAETDATTVSDTVGETDANPPTARQADDNRDDDQEEDQAGAPPECTEPLPTENHDHRYDQPYERRVA